MKRRTFMGALRPCRSACRCTRRCAPSRTPPALLVGATPGGGTDIVARALARS